MWADSYISTQIDQYFDVSSMQALFVKKAVNEDINKIKKHIFPRVGVELKIIQDLVENNKPLSFEQISSTRQNLKQIFYDGLEIFEPSAQEFVKKLDQKQLETFKIEFAKKTKELSFDLANPREAKKKRYTKIKAQIESWLGNLTDDQQLDIENFTNSNLFPIKEQIANRESLSAQFLESFKPAHDSGYKQKKFVSQLFKDYESMRDPAYVKALQQDQKKYLEMITTVMGKLTLIQRKYFLDVMGERLNQLK